MIPYLIAFSLSIVLTYCLKQVVNTSAKFHIYIKGLKKTRELTFSFISLTSFFSALPIILLSTLRWNVGTDFKGYCMEFFGVRNFNKEAGYKNFVEFIRQISNSNFTWYLFVMSILTIGIVFLAIWEQSEKKELSIYYYFTTTLYFCALNGMRQGVAIAISLYAMKYLKKNKIISYLICIAIGALFHMSILVCLVLPIIKRFNLKITKIVILLISIFALQNQIKAIFGRYIQGTVYYHYVFDQYGIDVPVTYIIMILACFLFASYIKKRYMVDDDFNCYYNILFVAIAIGAVCGWLPMGKRLLWNFMFVMIFIIPKMFSYIENKSMRFVVNVIFAFLFWAGMYSNIVINGDHSVIPYNWIL